MVAQDAPPGGRDAHPTRDIATVSERSAQTIEIAERNRWLLDIALDHLTLGRAALYRAILEQSPLDACPASIEQAVTGLRAAGTMHYLPRGLLTRGWLRVLEGHPVAARADLDEAQQIAGRGSMKLHLADIHLHPARLFGRGEGEGGSGKDPGDKNPDGTRPGTERRGGVLAAWAYGVIVVEGEEVNHLADEFYSETVGPGWPPERVLVEHGLSHDSLSLCRDHAAGLAHGDELDVGAIARLLQHGVGDGPLHQSHGQESARTAGRRFAAWVWRSECAAANRVPTERAGRTKVSGPGLGRCVAFSGAGV